MSSAQVSAFMNNKKVKPGMHRMCSEAVTEEFRTKCDDFSENEFALRFVYVFVGVCEGGFATEDILSGIETVCGA